MRIDNAPTSREQFPRVDGVAPLGNRLRHLDGAQHQQPRLFQLGIQRGKFRIELLAFRSKRGRLGRRIGCGRRAELLQPDFSLRHTRFDVGNLLVQIVAYFDGDGADVDEFVGRE